MPNQATQAASLEAQREEARAAHLAVLLAGLTESRRSDARTVLCRAALFVDSLSPVARAARGLRLAVEGHELCDSLQAFEDVARIVRLCGVEGGLAALRSAL